MKGEHLLMAYGLLSPAPGDSAEDADGKRFAAFQQACDNLPAARGTAEDWVAFQQACADFVASVETKAAAVGAPAPRTPLRRLARSISRRIRRRARSPGRPAGGSDPEPDLGVHSCGSRA